MNAIEWAGRLRVAVAVLALTAGIPLAARAETAAATSAPEPLAIAVGSHRLLRQTAPVGRVAVGDPKVADVNVVNQRELLVLGKAPGTTTLLIWPRASRKNRLPQAQEYKVSVGGFAGQTDDTALNNVFVQPGSGLSGATPDLFTHQVAVNAASAGLDSKATIADRSVVAVESQVMSEVKVVEVTRTTAQRYGLNIFGKTNGKNPIGAGQFISGTLSGVTPGTGTNGLLTSSATGFIPLTNAFNLVVGNNYFTSILSLLENKALARTLAEPSLTAMSGQTATFLAGGEFPVPVPQSSGGTGVATVTIQYKEFGIRLNLTPTVLSNSRIALKIAPEVSELDYTNGVNLNGYVVPGLIVRRTDTTVELGDGETFVLSGLVSNNMKANVDKVPLLGDLPVIGAFFKSNTYERDEKELIMVVTPHLVRPFARDAKLPELPGASIDGYQPGFAKTMFLERGDFGQPDHGYSR